MNDWLQPEINAANFTSPLENLKEKVSSTPLLGIVHIALHILSMHQSVYHNINITEGAFDSIFIESCRN